MIRLIRIIGDAQTVNHIEESAEEYARECSQTHARQLHIADPDIDARQSDDEDECRHCKVTSFGIVHLAVYHQADARGTDHPVEQEADTAHHRGGDRIDERRCRGEERQQDGKDSRSANHPDTEYFRDGHHADIFAVCCRRHRTKAS